jgi:catechol 2,3-dioxygenase-like lactoylglutathione lyase family enzyme
MLTNLGYVGIIVKDVAGATAFYRDTLGFTLEGAVPTMAQFFEKASCRNCAQFRQLSAAPANTLALEAATSLASDSRLEAGATKASQCCVGVSGWALSCRSWAR